MNVLLAEDQGMLSDALQQLLLLQEDIQTVRIANNGAVAIEMLQQETFDVAILDVEMPEKTGLDVLEWIREHRLDTKVIMVTTFKRIGYFERAMKADVDAYVLKERSILELMQTVRKVQAGQKEYSSELMANMFLNQNPLTSQEQLILKKVAMGFSNQDIAKQLHLSAGTVRNYISMILLKIGAQNRTEAAHVALDKGWI